jgi:hypothetical protein
LTTIDRIAFWYCDMLSYALCELAFRTHCWGSFAWAYRAGCWFSEIADEAGIRSGELVPNSEYRPGSIGPMFLRRGELA